MFFRMHSSATVRVARVEGMGRLLESVENDPARYVDALCVATSWHGYRSRVKLGRESELYPVRW